tara:strand:- start:316176 stop:317024 length:849 start_codon:yes stop_codon:yes gene_type:complete
MHFPSFVKSCFLIFILSACSSTDNTNNTEQLTTSGAHKHVCENSNNVKPIRVTMTHKDFSQSHGNAFWINTPYGNNIFITNAHVVALKNGVYKSLILKDANGKALRATIKSVRQIRQSSMDSITGKITTIKVADIAILETSNPVPQSFAATKLKLSAETLEGIITVKGYDNEAKLHNKCLSVANENNLLHLYSNTGRAVHGLSGTAAINNRNEVIGIVTTAGILINKNTGRTDNIFIIPTPNKKSTLFIGKISTPDTFWPLYATLTSAAEIQKFLNDVYHSE